MAFKGRNLLKNTEHFLSSRPKAECKAATCWQYSIEGVHAPLSTLRATCSDTTHVLVRGGSRGARQPLLLSRGAGGGGGHLAASPHPSELRTRARATSSMDGEMGPTAGPQAAQLPTTFLAFLPFPVGKPAPGPWDSVLPQELCWHRSLSPQSAPVPVK